MEKEGNCMSKEKELSEKELTDEELDKIAGGREITERERSDYLRVYKNARQFFNIDYNDPYLNNIKDHCKETFQEAFDEYMNMMLKADDNKEELLFSDFIKNNPKYNKLPSKIYE